MIVPSLNQRLTEELSDEAGVAIALSIFHTAEVDRISEWLERYCQQSFQHAIIDCSLVYFSVGATFVVRLANQQQVVVKAYNQEQSLTSLEAIAQVQTALSDAHFPCPTVLKLPTWMGETLVTAQSFHHPGERVDPFAPFVKATMARTLVKLMRQTQAWATDSAYSAMHKHLPVWIEMDRPSLWHTPHNVLFDFENTTAGAEWIDDIACQTKPILQESTGRWIIGHSDWSLQNMSVQHGQLTCVYDWDSLRVGLEPWFVGGAARCYSHDWRYGPPKRAIALDDVHAFIRHYEQARGQQPFSPEDYRMLGAALVYTAAYGVRCMHSIAPSTLQRLKNNQPELPLPDPPHVQNAKHQLLLFADEFL